LSSFYGEDQAEIHHREFGDLAQAAAEFLIERLRAADHHTGTIVDLGCGSGILARLLTTAGYSVFGVDLSADMVELARAQAPEADFVVGSVHDVDIPAAVGVTAVGEVLNYATDPKAGWDALAKLVGRVHLALRPGGVFLFDVSTPGRYGPAGRRVVFHDREDWSLAMEANEGEDTLDRRIVVFRRTKDGTYRRTDEHHVLRLYEPGGVVDILRYAGFRVEQRPGYGLSATRSTPAEGWAVFAAHA
jgi:SAM-dependent methyltransferase